MLCDTLSSSARTHGRDTHRLRAECVHAPRTLEIASWSSSPVRTRMSVSTGEIHTLPSPIVPVRAASTIASATCRAWSSSVSTSSRTFGTNSTVYSAPRYTSVCPRCRPKPCASVTVMPGSPSAVSASFTSSSLNGLTTAVTSFIASSPIRGRPGADEVYADMAGRVRRRRDEVGIGEHAELRHVEALDLDLGRDADLHEVLRDLEDQPHDSPRPDEADQDVEHLRDELAAVAVEQALARSCRSTPFQPTP